MPPALQAVLTSSGAVIYPAFGAVGDRWPWWNPRIGAPSRYRAFALGQSLGFGRSRLPCFAITSSSPSQSRSQPAGSSGSGDPLLVSLAAAQHGPGDARGLVGHGEQHDIGRPAHEQAREPGRTDLLLAPRPAEMGARAMHQQAPDVAVAALGDAA